MRLMAIVRPKGWFLGFRCRVITTDYGVPVDFAISYANIDDRGVLEALCERGRYPMLVGDKGYISEALAALLFNRDLCELLGTGNANSLICKNDVRL